MFNDKQERSFFVMDILEYSYADGVKRIATWDPDHKVTGLRSTEEVEAARAQQIQNKTLIVTTRIGEPYIRIK